MSSEPDQPISWNATPDASAEVEDLRQQVESLEERLDALEGIFSERVIDKEQSHVQAQKKDAREKLQVGESMTVVVEEPADKNSGSAVTHIDGVVTFIQQAPDAESGDTLEVKLTDVQPNYVHAIAV